MSTKQTTASLNTTARSAIVSSFVNALSAHDSSGNIITHVCETVNKYNKGEEISTPDLALLTNEIARQRGWKGKACVARVSEVRVVLRAYTKLPEAIKAFSMKAKRVHWHDGMKLARLLN